MESLLYKVYFIYIVFIVNKLYTKFILLYCVTDIVNIHYFYLFHVICNSYLNIILIPRFPCIFVKCIYILRRYTSFCS